MDIKRIDRGARESSESPPTPPSPPPYTGNYSSTDILTSDKNSKGISRRSPFQDPQSSPPSHHQDKPRRKRRSGSRSSSTRSHKRSRSRDKDKERSRKHSRRDRSRSKSRGRSRSKERRRSRSRNKSRDRHRYRESRRYHRQASYESDIAHDDTADAGAASQSFISAQPNAFKNDGSFMEMFKKMQEQMPGSISQPNASLAAASSSSSSSALVLQEKTAPPPPLMVGKRRGGRILKTGMVAKPKTEPTADQPKDAWSLYMAEVKKYREVCCQEEDNTRPLVK